jgi:hypothetical protein
MSHTPETASGSTPFLTNWGNTRVITDGAAILWDQAATVPLTVQPRRYGAMAGRPKIVVGEIIFTTPHHLYRTLQRLGELYRVKDRVLFAAQAKTAARR